MTTICQGTIVLDNINNYELKEHPSHLKNVRFKWVKDLGPFDPSLSCSYDGNNDCDLCDINRSFSLGSPCVRLFLRRILQP